MEARGFALDEDALSAKRRVEFVGKSRTDPSIGLRVCYPDSFPSYPPRVLSTTPVQLRRHHRPDTKEICTFGPSRRRWLAKRSGAEAIDEADEIIAAMGAAESSESTYVDDVPEPASALYNYANGVFILVTPAIAAFGAAMPTGSPSRFRLRFESWPGDTAARYGRGRGIVTEIGKRLEVKGESWQGSVLPRASALDVTGTILRLAEPPPRFTSISEFNQWLGDNGQERTDWMAFVFPEQSGNSTTQRLAWVIVRSKQKIEHLRVFVMDGGGLATRVPGLSPLADKMVVFVGCGSLGSKIASSLAATGLSQFGLVDFDHLEPDNAIRHECGVSFFGVPKIVGLRQRLLELNPNVEQNVTTLNMGIGGSNEAAFESELQQLLARGSLVVDTAGDHQVSRFLNDICGELKVPQVYASVTNGAWGGEIVRVIPGHTACWMCWFTQYELSRPPTEPAIGPGVFAPGCDQPTFTGTSYDLGVVAGLASSFVVDTLLIDDGAREHYEGDYIRWQIRDPDGRFVPEAKVLPVQRRNPCQFCNPN
jgi:molybdopterin/thiamine biosynthesis adenylyltransferase